MSDAPAAAVDLTVCDREPIHILGQIQPFGFLLAVTADWIVARASVNLQGFLSTSAEEALGGPAARLLCADAIHRIRNMATMLRGEDAIERAFDIRLQEEGERFDLAVHFSGRLLVIEAEPASGDRTDASALVRTMMSRVRGAKTAREFLQEAARQVRAATGFDRVMVYRFDRTGSGEVVAEARRNGVESFLGLNYPASDIPLQARALYLRNVFRIITDVQAPPVLINPQFDPTGAALDLSMSVLRAVSPLHVEYLKTMGVAASLSISIVVEGRLWGLFACHHTLPRRPNFVQRTAAELFGSMFSLLLESRLRGEAADYESKARAVADRLMTAVAQDAAQLEDAEWLSGVVADAIPCDGVGVFVNGATSLVGLTPDRSQFQGVLALLNRNAANQVFSTDHLSALLPEAAAYAERAAGLLAIPISRSARDYVVLFRSERLRSVRWAGDPRKPVQEQPGRGRISPRESFAEWCELVKGRATPFTDAEVRIAQNVRVALLEIVLRLSDAAAHERSKADERQSLLIEELNHRVRNILALIRGLVSQTRKKTGNPADMMQTLDLRIQALARAHDQVTSDRWEPGSLAALIETEVGAFIGARRDRVEIKGADVKLDPPAFTVAALLFHELTTNAAKYGALSDNGVVVVDWTRNASGDLHLSWREKGGPVVAAPTRRGFGSTIIERSVPHELGGAADVRYRVTGFEADFTIPGRHVVDTASPSDVHVPAAGPQDPADRPLADLAVLLVEDNLMIAVDCEEVVKSLGSRTVHVSASVEEALRLLAEETVDFAVLDLNLGRETSIPVADRLADAATPFIFATGYGEANVLTDRHRNAAIVTKPYTEEDLRRSASRLLQGKG